MIVGRSSECQEILRLREAAESGRGATRVLTGAPGIGKTALLDWAAEHAGISRVVAVECREPDRRHPFAFLDALVASLGGESHATPAEHADALRVVLDQTAAHHRSEADLGAALLSALVAAGRTGPLLLLVDGAQWTDDASRAVLAFVAPQLASTPVLLLLAARDCDPDGLGTRLPTLEVAGLSPLDAALLLGGAVGTRVAEELCHETDGNPLALLEISGHLTPEQRRGDAPLDPNPPIGDVLRRGFLASAASFGLGESRFLLLACTDSGLDHDVLGRAARQWGIDSDAVDRVIDAGLVLVDRSGMVRLAHPLLRVAVYQDAAADDRRRAHAIVAEALLSDSFVDDATPDAAATERRARHLAAAADGPDQTAADALAAVARIRTTPVTAAELWERAARLSPEPTATYERLVAAGTAFADGGEHVRAVEAFDEALTLVDDAPRRADVMILRTMPTIESLGTSGVREELDAVAAQLERGDPRLPVLDALSGAVAMFRGDFVGARDRLRSDSTLTPGPRKTMLAVAEMLSGDMTLMRDVVADAVRLAGAHDARFGPDEFVVFALSWADEHSVASRLVDRLVTARRINGSADQLAFALAARAYLYWRTGHWSAANADGLEAVELATGARHATSLARSLFVVARVEAGLGDTASALDHARASYDLSERLGLAAFSWHASAVMGFALLGDGRSVDAIDCLERAQEFSREREVHLLTSGMPAPDLIEAYVHCGNKARAVRLLEELAPYHPDHQGPLGQALFLRSRALLGGDGAAADYDAALERHAEVQAPFEAARTRLCFGEHLRRSRDVVAARRILVEATDAFAQLGARRWERRSATEADACIRGRVASARRPRADALTPQELRVALVVANGATSREAAAALFLSPRTVEYHLGKIYRKLALRSRSDLVRRVAADPEFEQGADQPD